MRARKIFARKLDHHPTIDRLSHCESLSLARAQFSRLTLRARILAAGRRDLGCEIGFLLLDSLAQSIAHKSRDLDRRADLTLSFLDRLRDRLGVIVDEGLLQQADFLVVGLQTALDDL